MELRGVVQVLTLSDRADFRLPTFKPFPFHITVDTDNKQGKHITGQEVQSEMQALLTSHFHILLLHHHYIQFSFLLFLQVP